MDLEDFEHSRAEYLSAHSLASITRFYSCICFGNVKPDQADGILNDYLDTKRPTETDSHGKVGCISLERAGWERETVAKTDRSLSTAISNGTTLDPLQTSIAVCLPTNRLVRKRGGN
jgi:hypothetical protein